MRSLAQHRPVFHNEADFQHALAWELRLHYPEAQVRFERRVLPNIQLDLDITSGGRRTAFELKYLTAPLAVDFGGEAFDLADQSAQDVRRYDVIRDITRIERIVVENVADVGFVIVLTNAQEY